MIHTFNLLIFHHYTDKGKFANEGGLTGDGVSLEAIEHSPKLIEHSPKLIEHSSNDFRRFIEWKLK